MRRGVLATIGTTVLVTGLMSATATGAAGHPAQRRAQVSFGVLGQPSLSAARLGTRCSRSAARFSHHDFGGFSTEGPTGIAIGSDGRLYVADDGGHRVLSWPNADALRRCQAADRVIGAKYLEGPEAVAVDGYGRVYVGDTLSHTVQIFSPARHGSYGKPHVLGHYDQPGADDTHFDYPRGVAVSERGTLFVADDFNNRVEIFAHPLSSKQPTDSIGAGDDGGFANPKALALVGDTLFVADWGKSRVLRFTGPFDTPDQVYASTATFGGLTNPVDLTVGPDGTLYVSDQVHEDNATRIATYRNAVLRTSNATKPAGALSKHVDSALGLAADASGRLFVAEYGDYRVVVRKAHVATGPVDGHATKKTRALLSQLRSAVSKKTNRVSIGQEMATFYAKKSRWYREFAELRKRHLASPAIMSTELSFILPGQNQRPVHTMLAHARAGGTVAIDWHPDNPVDPNGYTKPITTAQMQATITPGTSAYTSWRKQLARAAAELAVFAKAGVPVLFRPFVEGNIIGYFWWGDDDSRGAAHARRQAAFAALWADTVHYLTVTKHLHDLLFDYSVNMLGGSLPALDYYPGAGTVDVVGVDVYQEHLNLDGGSRGLGEYQDLVSTGKPFGLSEFGQSTDDNDGTGAHSSSWDARRVADRVRDSYPRTVYAIAWYSILSGKHPSVYGLSDVSHTAALFHDPLIRTIPFH